MSPFKGILLGLALASCSAQQDSRHRADGLSGDEGASMAASETASPRTLDAKEDDWSTALATTFNPAEVLGPASGFASYETASGRRYFVHAPPSYRPGSPIPVILVFHGGGGNAYQHETATGMRPFSDRSGFLLVEPEGTPDHELIAVLNLFQRGLADYASCLRQTAERLRRHHPNLETGHWYNDQCGPKLRAINASFTSQLEQTAGRAFKDAVAGANSDYARINGAFSRIEGIPGAVRAAINSRFAGRPLARERAMAQLPKLIETEMHAALDELAAGVSRAVTRIENPDATLNSLSEIVSARRGAAMRHRTWNAGQCCGPAAIANVDDVGFVRTMIAELKQRYSVDRRRIFATGFSNGGALAYRLGCELSDVIAAVAPVSGVFANLDFTRSPPRELFSCRPSRQVPVLAIHGENDNCIPFEGGPGACFETDYRQGVRTTLAFFSQLNHCAGAHDLNLVKIQGKASLWRNLTCPATTEVALWRIRDGGHSYPGGAPSVVHTLFPPRPGTDAVPTTDISANAAVWEFFKRHPLARQPFAADFDGDGKGDLALYDATHGEVAFATSSQGYAVAALNRFGPSHGVPVSGDYDGDGASDIMIYDPYLSQFCLAPSGAGFRGTTCTPFGSGFNIPLSGRVDGDQSSDILVYMPSRELLVSGENRAALKNTFATALSIGPSTFAGAAAKTYGTPDSVPIPGDYNGDGLLDLLLYEPAKGRFVLGQGKGDGTVLGAKLTQFGPPGCIAIPGDYDGDGASDIMLYHQESAHFYLALSRKDGSFSGTMRFTFGPPSVIPVSGDYDGDGKADVMLYDQNANAFYLATAARGFTATNVWPFP